MESLEFLKPSLSAAPLSRDGKYFALQHMEIAEYICLLYEGIDHLAVFEDEEKARRFRGLLGLEEHVDIVPVIPKSVPFSHYWYHGEMIALSAPLS